MNDKHTVVVALTLEEVNLLLTLQVYESDYRRNPEAYDALNAKLTRVSEKLEPVIVPTPEPNRE